MLKDQQGAIWVQFDDDNIGKELRREYARLFKTDIEKTWTPILEITRQFKIQMNGSYHVKRRQFPLKLGAAKTIHKAQGSTMKSAVIMTICIMWDLVGLPLLKTCTSPI